MIYVFIGIFIIVCIYIIVAEYASRHVELEIGKYKKDIVEIKMNEKLLNLFMFQEDDESDFKYFKNFRMREEIRNSKGRYIPTYNKALMFNRILVFMDIKCGSMVFAYIVDNFNIIRLGEIPHEYIEAKIGASIFMRCDDSIGINEMMNNEPMQIKENVFPVHKEFTSYGYSFTNAKHGIVQRGFFDDLLYMKNGDNYERIDHKCVKGQI